MLPLHSVYCSFGQIMRTLHNLNGTERVGKNSLIQQLQTVERLWYPSLSKDGSGYQSIRQSNNQYLGGIFYVVRPWHSCLLAKLHRRSVARVAFGAAQLPGSFGWATRRECLVAFARGTHFGTDSGGGGNFDFGWTVGNMGDLEASTQSLRFHCHDFLWLLWPFLDQLPRDTIDYPWTFVPMEVFLLAGLQVVRDEMAQASPYVSSASIRRKWN